ncbi:MAG: hypothetical protein HYY17_02030 [Planctomycetes bacterium]|nr:hypothetical protein [Planctomycetota bacterium]
MKKWMLTGALAIGILLAAESAAPAQIVVEYRDQSGRGTIVLRTYGGYYYGCGYYWSTPYYGGPYYTGWTGARFYRPAYWEPYTATRPVVYPRSDVTTAPVSSERLRKARMHKDVEEGMRRFKAADWRGAVDAFREAFLADTDSGAMQFYLGLALTGAGDLRNAEKAFRGAFESLKPEEALAVELPKLLRDAAKFEASAAPSPLAAGVVAFLLGKKDAARAELGKAKDDPAARKLLDHLGK